MKTSLQATHQSQLCRQRRPINLIAGVILAASCLAPAGFAANSFLDLNLTTPGFYDGSTTVADLTTTATWTTDTTGVAQPVILPAANTMIISNSVPGEFSGASITVNMSLANNLTGTGFFVQATNLTVTMSGSANCRWNNAFTWFVATNSTLIVTSTGNNNGFNFNSKAATFSGSGLINFMDAFCANGNAANVMSMTNGTIQLNQSKTSNFGGATGAAFTLTAGTLQFAATTALADTFGDWINNNVFTINGGTIDNTTGSAGSVALGNGTYKYGGNWTFAGSSSLSLGTTNSVALTTNVVITNLANALTIGGVSGTGFGLTLTGPGSVVICSNSTLSGALVVNSGGLVLSNSANLPNASAISFLGTSTFDLSAMSGQLTNPNTLALTNTTVDLTVPLAPTTNIVVGALNVGGVANTINIIRLPVILSYPATFALINYSNTLALTNFVLGTLPPSANTAFAGFISASTPNLIQLVITNGPPPARTLTWAGTDTGDNGPTAWDVATSLNWLTNAAAPATFYNQGDLVKFTDASASSPSPGQVNLQTTLTPSSVTVSNNALNYIFTGGGSLADPLTGPLQLVKQGTGTLTIDNQTPNTYTGGVLISSGTVRIGTNDDGFGDLGLGSVTDNGTLVFDGANTYTIPNTISGTGTVQQVGPGTLNLGGANTFSGGTTATAGVLQAGSTTAFGTNKITVNNGAILDLAGHSLGTTPVFAQGSGNIPTGGNQGAIDNSGATITGDLGLQFVTLTGDTTFSTSGGPTAGRWDLRSPGGDAGIAGTNAAPPSTAWLSTGGNPYNLTIHGSGFLGIVSAFVDPKLADIDVVAGTLDYEGGTTGLGNPTNTLTVENSAIFFLYNASNALNKVISLNDGALLRNNTGNNTIVGPISLNGPTSSGCLFEADGTTALNLNGPITGANEYVQNSASPGTINLNGTNSFTGGISVSSGNLVINSDSSAVTGPATLALGNLVVNGLLGTTTQISQGTLSGTGTNIGAVDVFTTLNPGGAGTVGTFTVGESTATNSLTLESSATANFELAATNTIGGGVNDLVAVHGDLSLSGNLAVNPIGLVETGVPYTLITYTGSLLTPNGAPNPPSSVDGYNFSIDTSVPGQVNITALAGSGPPVWNGGAGAGNTDWSQAANWSTISISAGLPLFFAGSTSLNNTNDTGVDTQYGNITFIAGAGPFVLNGNAIEMGSGILINNSSNPQTINLPVDFNTSFTFNGGSSAGAPLIIGGGLNDTGTGTSNIFNGFGILTNNLTGAVATNALWMTNNNANWTLMDNATSTPISLPWGFAIGAGTFNYGTSTSAPNFTNTQGNGLINGLDNQVGMVTGATGTFNMVNGTLTSTARFNTATATSSTGVINQSGGTWNLGGQFQGANGGNAGEISVFNVSGGTLNVGGAGTNATAQIYVASRGAGTFTVSGSAVVNCGTLDVSRDASGNTIGSTGTVNLNGGTVSCSRVGSATANSQAGPATTGPQPTAAFNFNGGTLVATANSTTFFQGNAASPAIPITTTVKSGGAIVNDGGFNISVLEIMLHDSTLGSTNDGGLNKLGAGSLTLTRANTYTGPTKVNTGNLTIASGGSLAAGTVVTIANGASLTNSGAISGFVTNNGTIIGAGTFGTNVIITATGTNLGTGTIAGNLTNSGFLSPGQIGFTTTLTVSNNLTDLAGSTTFMSLNRGATPSNAVITSVKGTITYAGTLAVTNSGATLKPGDSFKLFSATTYAGSFSSISPATPGAGLLWNTNALTTSGTLAVMAVPALPTTFTGAALVGTNLTISGSGGATNGTYRVLTSTNVNAHLSTWTLVGTGSFDASGHFSFSAPFSATNGASFFAISSP